MRLLLALLLALAAPAPAAAQGPPPHARLYAACFADAAARETYAVPATGYAASRRYLELTCQGDPARALFEALATRPPAKRHEETKAVAGAAEPAVTRFTEKPVKDTQGIDWCTRTPPATPDGQAAYACTLIYPAGSFLNEGS